MRLCEVDYERVIPTLVRVFLCPWVGPIPSVRLTLTWFTWVENSTSHHPLIVHSRGTQSRRKKAKFSRSVLKEMKIFKVRAIDEREKWSLHRFWRPFCRRFSSLDWLPLCLGGWALEGNEVKRAVVKLKEILDWEQGTPLKDIYREQAVVKKMKIRLKRKRELKG